MQDTKKVAGELLVELEKKGVTFETVDGKLKYKDSKGNFTENSKEKVKKYKEENPNTSILIITHHPKILEYLKPDFVHVMSKGKILETGDYSLANDIEKNGYNKYLNKENVITKEGNNE